MPVNEKILFGCFQCLFYLKTIIYAILSSAMLRENHAVLCGKNMDSEGGGGGNKYPFSPKCRPQYLRVYNFKSSSNEQHSDGKDSVEP